MAVARTKSEPIPPTSAEPASVKLSPSPHDAPWVVGKAYLIRTVTYFVLGRLVSVHATELVLVEASWVADTGRFHECLASGKLNEVEPYVSPVIVGRASICDATEWTHALPLKIA